MKKRYKFSTMLIAALIAVTVIASAAVAATRLQLFDHASLIPLEGAEAMIVTDLGSVKNDLVSLTVEEAVYDGRGAILKLQMKPNDDSHVLFNAFAQEASEEEYIVENVPVPVEGDVVYNSIDGTEFPTYVEDGVRYYADQFERRVTGRKDGKAVIHYSPTTIAEKLENDSWTVEEQEDGSLLLWDTVTFSETREQATLAIQTSLTIDGESIPLDELSLTLIRSDEEHTVKLVPPEDNGGDGFRILSGTITFTKVKGYMTLDFINEAVVGMKPDEALLDKIIDFRLYDAQGTPIPTGLGAMYYYTGENGETACRAEMEIQSFAEIPETLRLEAFIIDGGGTLGSIECTLAEE